MNQTQTRHLPEHSKPVRYHLHNYCVLNAAHKKLKSQPSPLFSWNKRQTPIVEYSRFNIYILVNAGKYCKCNNKKGMQKYYFVHSISVKAKCTLFNTILFSDYVV